MARRAALAFLAAASPAALAASLAGGEPAAWVFALAAAAFPVALMALGAGRRGRLGGAAWPLLALLVILTAAAAGILVLSGPAGGASETLAGTRLAGLPLATVIQIAGLWLLPLPLATLGYALSFDRAGVTGDDLARLRERAGLAARSDRPGAGGRGATGG